MYFPMVPMLSLLDLVDNVTEQSRGRFLSEADKVCRTRRWAKWVGQVEVSRSAARKRQLNRQSRRMMKTRSLP
jgi:hypothetical protein